MAVFALICPEKRSAVLEAIKQAELSYHTVGSESLFVSFKGTTQELSDKLGISEGKNGTAVVLNVTSYYGWGPTNMWEWVGVHWGD